MAVNGRDEPQSLSRRRALRVLSALAAAAAGAAAVTALRPEDAEAYVQTEPSTQFTGPIASTGGNGSTPLGGTIVGTNPNNGYAIYGETNAGGITSAIYGVSTGPDGTGVYGFCDTDIGSRGVQGQSDTGTGVLGQGGVYGVWGQGEKTSALGVYGINYGGGTAILGQCIGGPGINSGGYGAYGANANGGTGVLGTTSTDVNGHPAVLGMNGGAGPGVQGFSSGTGSIGISGGSDVGVGFWGTANGSGTGVLGSSISGTGVWGQSQSFFAGVFSGPVLVQGNFTVTGAKSAAVRGADGGLKRLYSLESPESWFEDFGSGQLGSGSATVQLEPGFAGVVHSDNYHVFLTPQGDSNGLYVGNMTPAGFTVHEQQGGKSNIGFSYRIVAKRKDIPGARLEHVGEPPTLPDNFKTPPMVPKLPGLPATPSAPTPTPGG
jgi:hypothetical protein